MTRRSLLALLVGLLVVPPGGAADLDDEASSYFGLRRLLGAGRPADALAEVRSALSRYPGSCRIHEVLVEAHQALGSPGEAVRELQKRLEVDEGRACPHYALGLAFLNVDDKEQALRELERARALDPAFPLTYRELAWVHRLRGTLGDVIAELEGELAKEPGRALLHYALGFAYNFRGDPAKAASHLDRALALDPDLLDAYRYLSQIRLNRGDFEESRSVAGELLRRADARGDLTYKTFALNALGNASVRLASYAHAVAYYLDGLSVQRELGDRQGQWSTLNGLGAVYDNLGDHTKAMGYFGQALETSAGLSNPRWKATTLHSMGAACMRRGDLATALGYYVQALPIRRRLPDARDLAYTLTDMGLAYVRQDRLAEGRSYLEEAEKAAATVDDAFLQAVLQIATGEANERGALEDKALASYGAALQIAERIQHREVVWRAQRGLGAVRLKRNELPAALDHYARAIEIIEGIRQEVQEEAARVVFLQGRMSAYEGVVTVLHRLHLTSPSAGYDVRALDYAQRAKARAFLDLLAEARADVRRGMSAEQREAEGAILRELARLQRALLQGSISEGHRGSLKAELLAAEEKLEAFKNELRRKSPEYAALRYPTVEPLDTLRAELLDPRTRLVQYMVGEQQSFAWLVSDRGLERWIVLPGRLALDAKVSRYRDLIGKPPTRPTAVSEASRLGHELFELVLAPFSRDMVKAGRLVVVPDGALHYLPLESLVTGFDAQGQPRYLLETQEVAYAPSPSVLVELGRRSRAAGPLELLAYGAPRPLVGDGAVERLRPAPARPASAASASRARPAPGELAAAMTRDSLGDRGTAPPALPNAGREVESIASLFPADRRRVRLGRQASESALKKEDLGRFRVLHLATHGLMDDRAPGRSGLLLAPGDAEQDGLLQGAEILNLELDADLVVLSACGTGLGPLVRGEGLVGLSRSFFYAGARTLVVSLWNVDDASTAQLMTAFYRRLRQGEGKARALALARREMLRSDRPAYRFPYYWAPFVLTGLAD